MDIGRQLRALRRARRRTLEELAAETGFTRSYLSQIETGEATPSLGALAAIAAALGTELAAFFPLRAGPAVHVARAGDPVKLRVEPNSHEEYVVLGGRRPGAAFTAVLARYFPGESVGRNSHLGERFALVLSGDVVINVGGERRPLAPGEWLHYAAQPEDTLEVVSHGPAEVLWLVVPAMI